MPDVNITARRLCSEISGLPAPAPLVVSKMSSSTSASSISITSMPPEAGPVHVGATRGTNAHDRSGAADVAGQLWRLAQRVARHHPRAEARARQPEGDEPRRVGQRQVHSRSGRDAPRGEPAQQHARTTSSNSAYVHSATSPDGRSKIRNGRSAVAGDGAFPRVGERDGVGPRSHPVNPSLQFRIRCRQRRSRRRREGRGARGRPAAT